VKRDGRRSTRHRPGRVRRAEGTNGQHAFFQQIHQGTDRSPGRVRSVVAKSDEGPDAHATRSCWSNALAQAQALMVGKTTDEARAELLAPRARTQAEADRLAPHKTFPGNRPSTHRAWTRLTPETLGALIWRSMSTRPSSRA
jgi:glucose-6-phosphate isomerase